MLNKKRLIAFVWVCTELNGRRDKGPPNFIPNRFGRTDGHIGTETNFKLEQASIGFEKVVNLTCGAVFYSQITEMHAIDNSIVASEQDLRILSEHIHDIRNMQVALNQKKCLKKQGCLTECLM